MNKPCARNLAGLLCLLALAAPCARAADDEIMVTDADLAKVGKPELEIHTNFSQGTNISPGEGEFAPNHVLRITPELSIGLTPYWDVGLYLPVSVVPGRDFYYDGVKVRTKLSNAHALGEDARIYYGLQFEAADVNPGVSPDRTSLEVKAIAGAALGAYDFAVNLVEQRDAPDHDLIAPGYAVNMKLVRDLGHDIAVGLENYVSWSSTSRETPLREIDKLTFVTVQWKARDWDLHLGLGHGWSNSPDSTIIKLVIGVPLE